MFTAFCVLGRLWSIRWGHPLEFAIVIERISLSRCFGSDIGLFGTQTHHRCCEHLRLQTSSFLAFGNSKFDSLIFTLDLALLDFRMSIRSTSRIDLVVLVPDFLHIESLMFARVSNDLV